jgi:hypothetical protein
MKSLNNNKPVVYALLVFIIAIVAYNYLLKSSQEAATAGITAEGIGNDVVTLDQSLSSVTLDQSVFSSAAYRSLTDWSPALSPGISGRNDPFAPIGQ